MAGSPNRSTEAMERSACSEFGNVKNRSRRCLSGCLRQRVTGAEMPGKPGVEISPHDLIRLKEAAVLMYTVCLCYAWRQSIGVAQIAKRSASSP